MLAASAAAEVYQPPDREPSPEEILILELINRFRLDPVGEAQRLNFTDRVGDEMKKMKPLPPLVMNLELLDAARKHSYYMILNTLTHVEEAGKPGFYGAGFGERAGKSGFKGFAQAENCFRDPGDAYGSHAGFAHSDGHRANMASGNREVGTGGVPHDGRISVTHLFGSRGVPRMAGGVVYQDGNGNKFYDVGEGIGGVRINASDGTGTITWKSGGYALDLKSAKAVTITAEFMGQKFSKSFDASGDNVKFDVIVPESLVKECFDKLVAVVDGAGAADSPKYFRAVLSLYMEAKGLRLDAERQKRFRELTEKIGPELETSLKAVRAALDDFEPRNFAKVLSESKKPYAGTSLDGWFRDAATIATVKWQVMNYEKQNAVQKFPPQQRRSFIADVEAAEKQLATTAFTSDLAGLIARARNPNAAPPTAAAAAAPTTPAGATAPVAVAPPKSAEPKKEEKQTTTTASATPAVLPPPAKAESPVSDQALATWTEKLRQRVIDGVKAGQKPTAFLALFGGKESSVKIVGADDKELQLEMGTGKLPVAWTRLDPRKDMLNLAKAFAKEDSLADRLMKAVFLAASGLIADAQDEYYKALELKPAAGDANVEAVRALLKL
jgi:uncharacterized protein YkwD